MSDQQGDDGGDEWRRSLPPGLSRSDIMQCTPKQIKELNLDELRLDERLWTAYERGWCDLLQSYMNMQLMQSETSYMLPELARPGLPGAAASGAAAVQAAAASASLDPESASSAGEQANASAAAAAATDVKDSSDKANGAPEPVRSPDSVALSAAEIMMKEHPSPRRIDVRVLSSRIKRTYKYADVRLCEFQGLGPRAVVDQTPPDADNNGESEVIAKQLSSIRIKITTPEATEFELTDTFDEDEEGDGDDEKSNAEDE
ncbi:uncharacterized protein LOC111034372 [Myzus persicae]|uniref:uncharacterized protein LOC111034372 n=1 Tax=Myzus persicae TaxID=13164 RepID=UPI000B9332E4|nr:uncharacterized protein LOC111034372 [Myzus persicae]